MSKTDKLLEYTTKLKSNIDKLLGKKVDIDQGIENANKYLSIDSTGKVKPKEIAGLDSFILNGNVSKQENPIIYHAEENKIKNFKLYGKSVQKQETNILPTPDNFIPIISKKVKIGEEYTELRSLKESYNLFDLDLLSRTELVNREDDEAYVHIKIPIRLKGTYRYRFYMEDTMIPAKTWAVLKIIDDSGNIVLDCFNENNTSDTEKLCSKKLITFRSPYKGDIYFSYYVSTYNDEGNKLPQTTELFKEKWFTKFCKNIMIIEENLYTGVYISPTIRDYKIVDHTNKTTKIIRNIKCLHLTSDLIWCRSEYGGMETDLTDCMYKSVGDNRYNLCTLFDIDYLHAGFPDNLKVRLGDQYLQFNYEGYNELAKWKEFLDTTEYEFLYQYQLATPVEEEIPYSETDNTELGYSFQDTTSPSVTFPSEFDSISEISYTRTGKNLFDINKIPTYDRVTNNGDGSITINTIEDDAAADTKNTLKEIANLTVGETYTLNATSTGSAKYIYLRKSERIWQFGKSIVITQDDLDGTIGFYNSGLAGVATVTISDIQIEKGTIATSYEQYQSQQITITPPYPFYSSGDVADEVDVEKGVYRYKLEVIDINGNEDWRIWRDPSVYRTKTMGFHCKLAKSPNNRNFEVTTDKFITIEDKTWGGGYHPYYGDFYECIGGYRANDDSNQILGVTIFQGRLDTLDTDGIKKFFNDNPIKVLYELAEPVEIAISENDLIELRKASSLEGINTIICNVPVSFIYDRSVQRTFDYIFEQLDNGELSIKNLEREVVKNV